MRNERFELSQRYCRCVLAIVIVALAATACLSEVDDETGETTQDLTYGLDNRQDVFAHSDLSLRRLARQATAAIVKTSDVNLSNPNNVTFDFTSTLGVIQNLCPGQPFASDPAVSSCSATLIDDDLVLTDGNCVAADLCTSFSSFVFNFYRDDATTVKAITSADVFRCKSIVAQQNTTVNGRALNFALVRLDRPATPRFTVAPVRRDGTALAVGQRVGSISTPNGIPFKIETGGVVRDGRASTLDFFTTGSDSFGASGGAIYDLTQYTLAGIMVRVNPNEFKPSGSCNILNQCAETGCTGQSMSYVGPALDALCSSATPSDRLCGPRNTFKYNASNTSSASVNTTHQFVNLLPGQTLTAGTCGVPGGSGAGNTMLRLLGPDGTLVASNDDGLNCGTLSKLSFTAPPLVGGIHEIQAGCSGATSCSGRVAYTVTGPSGGSFSFTETNTTTGMGPTIDLDIPMLAGQTITAGTCGLNGSHGTGDTFLWLFDNAASVQVTSSDDATGCGSLSKLTYTAVKGASVFRLRAGCFPGGSCSGTVAYTLSSGGTGVRYEASETNSATGGKRFDFPLAAGQTITVGTCGVPGSSGTDDTFLRLFNPANTEVASNDDGGGSCGLLSVLTFTAPTAGTYQLHAGCFTTSKCSGMLAYTLSHNDGGGARAYTATNTSSALTHPAEQPLTLEAGQTIKFGTCDLPGSTGTGDTFLRLIGPDSQEIASSDDACGGFLSSGSFTVPAGKDGAYLVRAGCFGPSSCTGTVAFTVE